MMAASVTGAALCPLTLTLAQRALCAAAILARAQADIERRAPVREEWLLIPSSAAIAWFSLSRSCLR